MCVWIRDHYVDVSQHQARNESRLVDSMSVGVSIGLIVWVDLVSG